MSENAEEDEDLYEMVLGEHLTVKEKKEVKKTEKEEMSKTEPDYAGLFRQLLIGSRAQIAQLKADNEKLKTNLQNTINSGGVVVCPNCTHHFNDRLCLLKPRNMRKMRARNCVELEFSTEDDLEAWLHLNQLETNNDGLPTIFKAPKEPKNEKTSLKDVGSLLPQLDAFRIPKRRAEDVKIQVEVKKQKSERREDVRIVENVKKQKIEKCEDVKKEPPKLSLKDRITMPSEDVRKRMHVEKDSEDVERKKKRAQIVWEEPEPVSVAPPTSITTSCSKFTFKITERVKKELPVAPEPVKVQENKAKFKFVPTSMKNKQDPHTVQSTSSGVTSSAPKCSEDAVQKAATSSSSSSCTSEARLQKQPFTIPIPIVPKDRKLEDLKIQKTSLNPEGSVQKPEDVKSSLSSKSVRERNLDEVTKTKTSNSEGTIQKARGKKIPEEVMKMSSTRKVNPSSDDVTKKSSMKSSTPSTKVRNSEEVELQKEPARRLSSNLKVAIQKQEDVRKKSSAPKDWKIDDVKTQKTSSSFEAPLQKTETKKIPQDVKKRSSLKSVPNDGDSDDVLPKKTPKQTTPTISEDSIQKSDERKKEKPATILRNSEDVRSLQKTPTSVGPFKKRTSKLSRQSSEEKECMSSGKPKSATSSAPDVLGKILNASHKTKSTSGGGGHQKSILNRCSFPTSSGVDKPVKSSSPATSSEGGFENPKTPTPSAPEERIQKMSPRVLTSSAPEATPSWNLLKVKKSPEVLEHIKKNAERRLKEGRRQIDEMIVVDERKPTKVLSLESFGVSREGLEILKRQLNASKSKEDVSAHEAPDQCAPAPTESAPNVMAPRAPSMSAPAPTALPCAPRVPAPSDKNGPAPVAPKASAPPTCAPVQCAQDPESLAPSTSVAQTPLAPAPSTRAPLVSNPCAANAPAPSASEDDDDVLKEFFPTLSHPPKRFSILNRQNSEFSSCSETASVFADGEELELLNLMRVESVIPPDGDLGLEGVEVSEDVNDDDKEDEDEDEDEYNNDNDDDFCLEDVVIDGDQRTSETTTDSDEWDLEHIEEPVRSESNVLEMKNDFRLSDDEDAISPVTSTPKRRYLDDDVRLGEDDDFTMRMRDDSFQDELDWNYGLEDDEEDVPLGGEEDEREEGEIAESPRENRHVAEEQKTSRRETVALLKRRN